MCNEIELVKNFVSYWRVFFPTKNVCSNEEKKILIICALKITLFFYCKLNQNVKER